MCGTLPGLQGSFLCALSWDPAVVSIPPLSLTRQFETQGLSDLPKVTRLVGGLGVRTQTQAGTASSPHTPLS